MPDTPNPTPASTAVRADREAMAARRWRPGLLTIASSLLAIIGLSVVIYPSAASWLTSYNQSLLIEEMGQSLEHASPGVDQQLALAKTYNNALSSGVVLDANANVPTGSGITSNADLRYEDMLSAGTSDVMARLRIPGIDVDLPIYHGTSDETLLRGIGHLEGSSLPIGGADTHSVLTAHRGLAQAEMFTNLDKVGVGDRFTVEVFGEVLTYEVRETKVVDPEDTDSLHAVSGEDLVTLVTCTPLGINSQRILVTGERVTPTPIEDIAAAGEDPTIPGFPWWAVIYGGGLLAIGAYFWRSGYGDARRSAVAKAR